VLLFQGSLTEHYLGVNNFVGGDAGAQDEWSSRPGLVAVHYKPVAVYIQDTMLTCQCHLYVDGIPAFTRRDEHEAEPANTGLRRHAVRMVDGMGEATGAM
jgi:hypothetical protein